MEKITKRAIKFFLVLCMTYLITGILLLGLSLLMYKVDVSGTVAKVGIILVYIISTLAGGFFIGKIEKKRKFVWGALMGTGYFFILFLISGVFHNWVFMDLAEVLMVFVISLVAATIGGMLS